MVQRRFETGILAAFEFAAAVMQSGILALETSGAPGPMAVKIGGEPDAPGSSSVPKRLNLLLLAIRFELD